MKPTPDDRDKLEALVHRTLRELPARHAPRSLEQRVLAELGLRAARPWWRKSFNHWPLSMQAMFILVSAGLVKLVLMINTWVTASVEPTRYKEAVAQQFSWVESSLTVMHAISGFFEIMFRNIPPFWLYLGLASFAMMHLALFGFGAAAYKALHLRR